MNWFQLDKSTWSWQGSFKIIGQSATKTAFAPKTLIRFSQANSVNSVRTIWRQQTCFSWREMVTFGSHNPPEPVQKIAGYFCLRSPVKLTNEVFLGASKHHDSSSVDILCSSLGAEFRNRGKRIQRLIESKSHYLCSRTLCLIKWRARFRKLKVENYELVLDHCLPKLTNLQLWINLGMTPRKGSRAAVT